MSSNPKLISMKGCYRFIDNDDGVLHSRRVMRLLERYQSYFDDLDQLILAKLNYLELSELIDEVSEKLNGHLEIDHEIKDYIANNRYAMEEHKMAGLTIKSYDSRWDKELADFRNVLDNEIERPLKSQQLQDSFFLAKMQRAANFSVPGSGKTAMTYGAFAYLSSSEINEVNKLLVIGPISSFESWRSEYEAVFSKKRTLNFINMRDYDDIGRLRMDWGVADVIVINYESLARWRLHALNELIDAKTMIVFDEVHRIKDPQGTRAKNALILGKEARYHYVLTGTPIPNSYKDIYNFLHLLYDNEYNTFFGWNIADLERPNVDEVNEKLQPFFWRTNKKDLQVPPADPDNTFVVSGSQKQQELAETIYATESNVLARYIRLLQASTNPALLTEKIDVEDMGFLFGEIDYSVAGALNKDEERLAKKKVYLELGVENMRTPKFEKAIQKIKDLVSEKKKVIVWCMFVGTMKKVCQELRDSGISTNLIYGGTDKNQRVALVNDFRDGDTQVLVTNPATLGESISLHQTTHDAVYLEFNFNLTFMLQSRDRIHRLGLPPDQYTRYYYFMTKGDPAHKGYIDCKVYDRLKEKESVMLDAIDGKLLVPMIDDDYLEDVKRILETS